MRIALREEEHSLKRSFKILGDIITEKANRQAEVFLILRNVMQLGIVPCHVDSDGSLSWC